MGYPYQKWIFGALETSLGVKIRKVSADSCRLFDGLEYRIENSVKGAPGHIAMTSSRPISTLNEVRRSALFRKVMTTKEVRRFESINALSF